MAIAISPKHTTDDFPNGMTLDDKIEVFSATVEGWQLGVAGEMISKGVSHRGFAQLLIITSYFEMIAKYREGFTGERDSFLYFSKGVRAVFPEIDEWPYDISDGFLKSFYHKVRNGLYHIGRTKSNVMLTGELPAALHYDPSQGVVYVDPDKLVEALQEHFASYAAELRDKSLIDLRNNFEKRLAVDSK